MPLLPHHDHVAAGLGRGRDHVVDEAGRKAGVPVADLLFLAVVHTGTMTGRYPLGPPSVEEPARLVAFLTWTIGVATKVEVRLVAKLRERSRKSFHADSKATRLAVFVRALEAEDGENRSLWLEDHFPESARRAVACSSRFGAQRS